MQIPSLLSLFVVLPFFQGIASASCSATNSGEGNNPFLCPSYTLPDVGQASNVAGALTIKRLSENSYTFINDENSAVVFAVQFYNPTTQKVRWLKPLYILESKSLIPNYAEQLDDILS